MKTNFTIFLLMLISLSLWGQSQTDQEAVLKLCIDLREIQNLFPNDAYGQPQAVRVMQHAVSFDADLSLSKFGKDVEFLSKDQIINLRSEAFLRFDKFEVDYTSAEVAFDFDYNRNDLSNPKRLYVRLFLSNRGSEWTIEESKFEWR